MQKLYCYVDESGQDTKGRFFVVGVVVFEQERLIIENTLQSKEIESGKKNIKWHKARPGARRAYLEAIAQSPALSHTLFFETFTNTRQYLKMTAYAAAKAIFARAQSEYCATIFVDGLMKTERRRFEEYLKELRVRKRKVRGVRRDENDVFIRLADAVCGLVRDARDGDSWSLEILGRLIKKGIVTAL